MSTSRRGFLRTASLLGAHGLLGVESVFAIDAEGDREKGSSPFLEGNYAPIYEEITADGLEVVGALPGELNGMFVRNGPNPQFPPKGRYHWFDGDGMLHGVRLRDGRASYRNRYVRTPGWREENKAGKALWSGLSEPPDLAKIARGLPPFKNTANTALVWHDGRLLALWEGGEPYEVTVPDLGTVGPCTFGGALKHPFTAHPKVDPTTGEMLFFGYQVLGPALQYSVASREGKILSTTPIELARPVMMHDFAITERYTVFLDLPATFDLSRAVRGEPILKFEPDRGARIGVLPRHGTGADVKWFETPACYVFHTLNAYEDEDAIVLTACRMNTFPDALSMASPNAGQGKGGDDVARLYRWRLDLADGTVQEERLDDVGTEFPRLNEALMGRKNRFGYTLKGDGEGFVKYDLEKGTSTHHDHGPGRKGGEGVFVPRTGVSDEDSGWVVTYVYDRAKNKSEFVVVDATEFERFQLPGSFCLAAFRSVFTVRGSRETALAR